MAWHVLNSAKTIPMIIIKYFDFIRPPIFNNTYIFTYTNMFKYYNKVLYTCLYDNLILIYINLFKGAIKIIHLE